MKKINNKTGAAVMILVLIALVIIGLFIGGANYSWEVIKGILTGAAVGAAIRLVLILFAKTKAGKKLRIGG